MRKIDQKLEHIRLQHQISEVLRKDNGVSSHFDYHVNPLSEEETIKLNVLTYNEKHNEYMLLHTTKGASSIACLKSMLDYLNANQKSSVQYSYTVKWKKVGETSMHTSYFQGSSEEEVKRKFLHEKDQTRYDFTIEQNPIA